MFISNTNEYHSQPSNQDQPQRNNQYQPQSNDQYQPQPNNQYQPQPNNYNIASQNTPSGQVFNSRLPKNTELVSSSANYPESIQQQYPVRQNFDQNSPMTDSYRNINSRPNIYPDLSVQSPQFVLDQDNYGPPNNYEPPNYYGVPNNYGNAQVTQNTYLTKKEQNNSSKNKIRFPFVNENYSQTGYNRNQSILSNPSTINPNSWLRGQIKAKQRSNQNSYPNGYTNKQIDDEDYELSNNQFNKPDSNFDIDNQSKMDNNKQSNFQNIYNPMSVKSQSNIDYIQQPSSLNGQGYNPNLSPSYSTPLKFDQYEKPQNSYSTLQDRQIKDNSKINKQFRIVVPNISTPTYNRESSYTPNTNPSKELIFNTGSPDKKSLTNYNGMQYLNSQNVSNTDKNQFPSQGSSVYVPSIKCPDGFNGIRLHPTDCSKFLSCANGRTFEMDCGPGTLFNPMISVCDYPFNVKCNQIIQTTTTPSITEVMVDYTPSIDLRQQFDHDTDSSIMVTETLENQNQAVLETLPTENRQLKFLRNPTSIDLPDNFLPNSSIIHIPKVINNGLENNITVKLDLKPNSTQSIRLRGSPKINEGFLQVLEKPFKWGVVCDEPNSWTIEKADIICKQLGFKRYLLIFTLFNGNYFKAYICATIFY